MFEFEIVIHDAGLGHKNNSKRYEGTVHHNVANSDVHADGADEGTSPEGSTPTHDGQSFWTCMSQLFADHRIIRSAGRQIDCTAQCAACWSRCRRSVDDAYDPTPMGDDFSMVDITNDLTEQLLKCMRLNYSADPHRFLWDTAT